MFVVSEYPWQWLESMCAPVFLGVGCLSLFGLHMIGSRLLSPTTSQLTGDRCLGFFFFF